jgi:ankyrin repeat protein
MNVMSFLWERGAVDTQDNNDNSLLHFASYYGHLNVVSALISKGSNVNARNDDQRSPLHNASLNGYLDVVNTLIASGAEVDALDASGSSPLQYVADREFFNANAETRMKIANVLIANGANVNGRNKGILQFFTRHRLAATWIW